MPECDMAIVHDDDLGQLLGARNESLEVDQITDHLESLKPTIGITAGKQPELSAPCILISE
jgi:hypothetical protein